MLLDNSQYFVADENKFSTLRVTSVVPQGKFLPYICISDIITNTYDMFNDIDSNVIAYADDVIL